MVKLDINKRVESHAISMFGSGLEQYNRLKNMDDSIFTYGVSKPWWEGPKMVFKIDTGMMPKPLAEIHLKKLHKELSRRVDYNPKTGEVK